MELPRTDEKPRRLAPFKEALIYARMGKSKMYALMHQNRIKGWKREGRTFVDLDSIDAYNHETLVPWGRTDGRTSRDTTVARDSSSRSDLQKDLKTKDFLG